MSKDQIILNIAKSNFSIETLTVQNSDSLDFHDVFVGSIKKALEEAYQAGIKSTEPDFSHHGDKLMSPAIYAIREAEKNGFVFSSAPESIIKKIIKKAKACL